MVVIQTWITKTKHLMEIQSSKSPPEHELVALKYPVTTCHLVNNSDKNKSDNSKDDFWSVFKTEYSYTLTSAKSLLWNADSRSADSWGNVGIIAVLLQFFKQHLLMTLVSWLLTSCAFFWKLGPWQCPLPTWQLRHYWFETPQLNKMFTYYWHITDNGKVVFREPLTSSGF